MMKNTIPPAPAEFTETQIIIDPILRYFYYAHLPEPLQSVSSAFCSLAGFIVDALPRNPERTVALRKLLEAKDAGVRANVGELAERTTARQSDKPDEEITENIRMIGGDQSEEPVPFKG